MGSVRALMFDFNGTLSDDEPLLLAIYQRLFARHGRPLSEEQYYGRLAGLSEEAIIGGWLGVDGPLLASLVAERVEQYADRGSRRLDGDGATARGAPLRGGPCSRGNRLRRVPCRDRAGGRAAGIAADITTIVAADDVEHGKPPPGRATSGRSSGSG